MTPHSTFDPADAQYQERVRSSFDRQGAMATLQAYLSNVYPGGVDISFNHAEALTQQHGFIHAGMLATALDSACGYAGFSLMAAGDAVLTIEFKINLLAPARGERFRAEGRVIKPGRTITVCEGRAYAVSGSDEKLIATMSCTLMCVKGRADVAG